MLGRIVTLLAAGAAGYALACARRNARIADNATSRAMPEPLQRWEGEGGAVQTAASRTAGGAALPMQNATSSEGTAGAASSASDLPGSRDSPQPGGALL